MRGTLWRVCVSAGLVVVAHGSGALADASLQATSSALGLPLRQRSAWFDASARVPALIDLQRFSVSGTLLEVAPGIGARRFLAKEIADELAPWVTAPPRRELLNVSRKHVGVDTTSGRPATELTGAGVVVGVVDSGFDIWHRAFRNPDGSTRIAWLLVNGVAPSGVHAKLEESFGCTMPEQQPCAVLSAKEIDAILEGEDHSVGPQDARGHGTHVASIAAGSGGPQDTYRGVAPEATLVFAAVGTPEGSFYDADILNATRFIFDRADALGRPAVVNLSVGGDFGPHDGTSLLEQGLASFVGATHPGRAMVIAAGNSGSLYSIDGGGTYGVHTQVYVSEAGRQRVPVVIPGAARGQVFAWLTLSSSEVRVGLEGTDGEAWIEPIGEGDEAGVDEQGIAAGVINQNLSDRAPLTSGSHSAIVSWDGEWEKGSEFAILLEGRGRADLWLFGAGDAAPSASTTGPLFPRALATGTVNVPATHPNLLAVGCTVNRLSWKPLGSPRIELSNAGGVEFIKDAPCFFSSAGPTAAHVMKPEISAPGGFVAAAMSELADPRVVPGGMFDAAGCPDEKPCFVVDNEHAITGGTSMSSPHVAGAIALLFQKDPTLVQGEVLGLLVGGSRKPMLDVAAGSTTGPGSLDLMGTFSASDGGGGQPFAAGSWWTTSTDLLLAGEGASLTGTVMLRDRQGHPARIDAADLDVRVRGATLESKEVIGPGYARFTVTAASDAGLETAALDVFVAGERIGEPRSFPIQVDPWLSKGSFTALGGCSMGTSQKPRMMGPGITPILLMLLGRQRFRGQRSGGFRLGFAVLGLLGGLGCRGAGKGADAPMGGARAEVGGGSSVSASGGAAGAAHVGGQGGAPDVIATLNFCEASCSAPSALGTVGGDVEEASGLAASRVHDGVYYVHNDSGDTARVFAVDSKAAIVGEWDIGGAGAIDWEDIAVGPCGSSSCVYVADFGDNFQERDSVTLYRFEEPKTLTGSAIQSKRLRYSYPDGPQNAEALLVGEDAEITVISKVNSGKSTVYRVAGEFGSNTIVEAEILGSVAPSAGSALVTAADWSPSGILLRTYTHLWFYSGAGSAINTLSGVGCSLPVADESQGETVAFRVGSFGYLTLSEGSDQRLMQSTCQGK